MLLFDRDNPPEIPNLIGRCPICGAKLEISDIDEWETYTGRVTESGFHINCVTQPEIDSKDWDSWWNWHWSMPYVDWLPLTMRVYKWFDSNYRLYLDDRFDDDSGEK